MPICFQADADLNQIIVSAVVRRVPAIDFRTATSAGLAGLTDQEVLAVAARDGRILVTHDQATMPRHFGEFVRSQRSPGLIVVPQHLPLGEVANDLILICAATEAEEWTDRIAFLPI
jgi:predicted nuclease of predicted toxin-antitoxin system